MAETRKNLITRGLALGGVAVFIFFLGVTPLTLLAGLLVALDWLWEYATHRPLPASSLPLAAGFLCPVFYLLYWDRFDLIHRSTNLLLISLLGSLLIILYKTEGLQKLAGFFNELPLKKRLVLIFVVSELLFMAAAWTIRDRGISLVGDEQHYPVVAQSIVQDFDLNVFNQYLRGKYRSFLNKDKLPPHGNFGKGYKRMYSIHLPGMPLTLAPVMLIPIPPALFHLLIRFYMGLYGALVAVVVYLFALKLWNHRYLALVVCGTVSFTAPVFFLSFHIFAEIQVLLLLLSALYLLLYSQKHQTGKILIGGILLGMTALWGVRYNVLIYSLSCGFFIYFLIGKRYLHALMLVIGPLFFQVLFFYFLYTAYGSFSPASIYKGMMNADKAKAYMDLVMHKIPLKLKIETLLDAIFDQRDGILPYNPLYFFAFPGLIVALKKGKTYRYHLLVSLAGVLYFLSVGYSTVRAGHSPQARYLVPIAWIFVFWAVVYYLETRNHFMKKLMAILPLYSIFVVVYQTLHPLTLYQTTTHEQLERAGLMFQQWSSLNLYIPDWLSSYIKVDNNFSYWPNIVTLGLFALTVLFSLLNIKGANLKYIILPLGICTVVVFALFPRIHRTPAVQVRQKDLVPHLLVGQQPSLEHPLDNRLIMERAGQYRYLIVTGRLPGEILVEIIKHDDTDVSIDLYNYDRKILGKRFQGRGTYRFSRKKTVTRRVRNRFYFQFTVVVHAPPSQASGLELKILPRKTIAERTTIIENGDSRVCLSNP